MIKVKELKGSALFLLLKIHQKRRVGYLTSSADVHTACYLVVLRSSLYAFK